jgi:hypothetical protein
MKKIYKKKMLPLSLDCSFLIVAQFCLDVYLLPIVCPVSCVTNVSSISGFPNPEKLEKLITPDTEQAIGNK